MVNNKKYKKYKQTEYQLFVMFVFLVVKKEWGGVPENKNRPPE